MASADLVTVATFPDVPQAELARQRLEMEGVQAFVFDEQTVAVMPFMAGSLGGIRVQVSPDDEAKAREILGA